LSLFFSKTLTDLAKARGVGYERLAALSDRSPVYVWRLMVGQKSNPSLATIAKLADALTGLPLIDGAEDRTVDPNLILGRLLIAATKDAVAKE
jgi:transcriptional regulator with XRE-family HTH domain